MMKPNETHFSHPSGQRFQFSKPNIFEVDLHDQDTRDRQVYQSVDKLALTRFRDFLGISSTFQETYVYN